MPCDCKPYVDRQLDLRFEGSDRFHAGKLAELEKRVALQFEATDKSTSLALREVDRHFEHVNQFQQRLERLENTFVTKGQLEDRLSAIFAKLVGLTLAAVTIASFILGPLRGH